MQGRLYVWERGGSGLSLRGSRGNLVNFDWFLKGGLSIFTVEGKRGKTLKFNPGFQEFLSRIPALLVSGGVSESFFYAPNRPEWVGPFDPRLKRGRGEVSIPRT